jgi:hypothetical protein
MSNPDKTHFKALERIWQYLVQYPDFGLLYNCTESLLLKVFSDSDWASSIEDRLSTQAYISLLGNNPINWSVEKQKTIALSSTEAEYIALKAATQEAVYLSNVLNYWSKELDLKALFNTKYPTILVDNLSAKDLSENPQFHKRTKHIDINYHYTRKCVEEGKVKIAHIPDTLQLADPLTKGLFRPKIAWFIDQVGLRTPKEVEKSNDTKK